jgi:Icc-related predicted phosphoesterase
VHVLITHGPPHGILDEVVMPPGKHQGCEALRERLGSLPALRVHAFGHIHEAYGTLSEGACRFVNASICDFHYAPVNAPVVVDL